MSKPIYYINAASAVRRRAHLEARLAELSLAFQRIEAVTPDGIDSRLKAKHCDRRQFRWLTESELACSLSHIKALKTFLDSGEDVGLILEDDVHMASALPAFLATYGKSPHVDVLKIETLPTPVRVAARPLAAIDDGFTIRAVYSQTNGAAAYIVTRRAASVIVDDPSMLQHPTDIAIFTPFRWLSRRLRVAQLEPGLCRQYQYLADRPDIEGSMITGAPHADRDGPEKRPLPRLAQRACRTVEREVLIGVPRTVFGAMAAAKKRTIAVLPWSELGAGWPS